ncbi:MAG: hypothetical protein Q9M50_15285, partial [Methylococcales bacterium]|nr:hypothetical protein [Methylococcales bacterium]
KDNILCEGKGATLLKKWCQEKTEQYQQTKEGISAFLRRQILLEILDKKTVETYRKEDEKRWDI